MLNDKYKLLSDGRVSFYRDKPQDCIKVGSQALWKFERNHSMKVLLAIPCDRQVLIDKRSTSLR